MVRIVREDAEDITHHDHSEPTVKDVVDALTNKFSQSDELVFLVSDEHDDAFPVQLTALGKGQDGKAVFLLREIL